MFARKAGLSKLSGLERACSFQTSFPEAQGAAEAWGLGDTRVSEVCSNCSLWGGQFGI